MWNVMHYYASTQTSFMASNNAYKLSQQRHNYSNYGIRSKGANGIFILPVGTFPGSAEKN